MMIAIASDHAGFALKTRLIDWLEREGHAPLDLGPHDDASVDYPDYALAVREAIAEGRAEKGVLVCGSGIGMCIAANRDPAVRAALCMTEEMAELSRRHNDANVLCLGARLTDEDTAFSITRMFLATPFEGGRHARRVEKLGI